MANIIPRSGRLIGTIIPDLVIDEHTTDAYEIVSHPVQQGSSISDHKYKKPVTLEMTLQFSGANQAELGDKYNQLLTLQDGSDLFDVITLKRVYKNMQIKSLTLTTDKTTENILAIKAEFQEVIVVSVMTTDSFPPKAVHKKPGKTAGTKNTASKSATTVPTATAQKKQSALSSFAKGFGF
jgi:hypothetical protein